MAFIRHVGRKLKHYVNRIRPASIVCWKLSTRNMSGYTGEDLFLSRANSPGELFTVGMKIIRPSLKSMRHCAEMTFSFHVNRMVLSQCSQWEVPSVHKLVIERMSLCARVQKFVSFSRLEIKLEPYPIRYRNSWQGSDYELPSQETKAWIQHLEQKQTTASNCI